MNTTYSQPDAMLTARFVDEFGRWADWMPFEESIRSGNGRRYGRVWGNTYSDARDTAMSAMRLECNAHAVRLCEEGRVMVKLWMGVPLPRTYKFTVITHTAMIWGEHVWFGREIVYPNHRAIKPIWGKEGKKRHAIEMASLLFKAMNVPVDENALAVLLDDDPYPGAVRITSNGRVIAFCDKCGSRLWIEAQEPASEKTCLHSHNGEDKRIFDPRDSSHVRFIESISNALTLIGEHAPLVAAVRNVYERNRFWFPNASQSALLAASARNVHEHNQSGFPNTPEFMLLVELFCEGGRLQRLTDERYRNAVAQIFGTEQGRSEILKIAL